jgi:hypothetical protein
VLAAGLINLAAPSYGREFLKALRSVYPGFRYSRTASDVLVGTGYALLDGAAAGALYAVAYNQFRETKPPALQSPRARLEAISQ